jgi:hypothetical protein
MAQSVKTHAEHGETGCVSPKRNPPVINERRLGRIIDILYKGIIHSQGLYAHVKTETHAPQHVYYPGSPKVQPKEMVASSQMSFFSNLVASEVSSIHKERPLEIVLPGTLKHRQWLWFATLTDRREDSRKVYEAHCRIYADHPQLYTEDISDIGLPELRSMIGKKYKIGSPMQSVPYWQICATTLFTRFEGDPVVLLKHAGWSVESVYAWKQLEKKKSGRDPIPGWGRKLLSLYFLYLSELGYPIPHDVFASDVHAQALVLQTRSFDYGDRATISSASLAETIRKFVSDYCRRKNYEIGLLAHASWLLGSTLCDECSRRRGAEASCVVYKYCGGRIDTSHYWKRGEWPKGLPQMNKGSDRPAFGLPTDVRPRLRQRGAPLEESHTVPLFPMRLVK